MIYIVVGILGLWLLFEYPQIVLFAVIALIVIHYTSTKQEKSAEKKEILVDPTDKKIYGDFIDDNGVVDWEGYNRAKIRAEMKEDFEKDPEWQRKSAEIREVMRQNKIIAEQELQEDINKELNEAGRDFWAKRR